MNVKEIGEQGLLTRVQRFCPPEIIGDDAAVLALSPGYELVVTTDMLVDEVHFSDRTTSPVDAGWRAVAANLSDLAAMGASPLGITIGLGLTGETPVQWVEDFYQGLSECLQSYSTPLVGGDIVRSPVRTVSITALGQVLPGRAILRTAAQAGDQIVVTGVHGASRAGLEFLLHPEWGRSLSETQRYTFIKAHQRPKPRLEVLSLLEQIIPVPAHFRVAGMDSSDGLADAILQICRASGVGANVRQSQIPFPPGLTDLVSATQALNWVLYGGEDFELVLCLPPSQAQACVEYFGTPAAIIGEITAEPLVKLIPSSSENPEEVLTLRQGFQHF